MSVLRTIVTCCAVAFSAATCAAGVYEGSDPSVTVLLDLGCQAGDVESGHFFYADGHLHLQAIGDPASEITIANWQLDVPPTLFTTMLPGLDVPLSLQTDAISVRFDYLPHLATLPQPDGRPLR